MLIVVKKYEQRNLLNVPNGFVAFPDKDMSCLDYEAYLKDLAIDDEMRTVAIVVDDEHMVHTARVLRREGVIKSLRIRVDGEDSIVGDDGRFEIYPHSPILEYWDNLLDRLL